MDALFETIRAVASGRSMIGRIPSRDAGGASLIDPQDQSIFGLAVAGAIVGLLIAAVALKEGLEAWRGEGCACVSDPLAQIADSDTCASAGESRRDGCD